MQGQLSAAKDGTRVTEVRAVGSADEARATPIALVGQAVGRAVADGRPYAADLDTLRALGADPDAVAKLQPLAAEGAPTAGGAEGAVGRGVGRRAGGREARAGGNRPRPPGGQCPLARADAPGRCRPGRRSGRARDPDRRRARRRRRSGRARGLDQAAPGGPGPVQGTGPRPPGPRSKPRLRPSGSSGAPSRRWARPRADERSRGSRRSPPCQSPARMPPGAERGDDPMKVGDP